MHFLITAGGTREYLDPVRFLSNASTGKMGLALARAALKAGHVVTLIPAPMHLRIPAAVTHIPVVSASDMCQAVQDRFAQCDALIMAAAVSDYTVVSPSASKLKKTHHSLTLALEPTVDILQWAGAEKKRLAQQRSPRRVPWVIGFALEDEKLWEHAEDKLLRKHLDMIVANSPMAIGADRSELFVKTPSTPWEHLPIATKATQAQRIIDRIQTLGS